ncbi:arsenate reductase (thioredoxin) [Lacticaseibacillus parahuelsenbergensis]|uniref:Arsenate reductase (Thioredoxin) n=1 Tax=Lacticaseibacillus parahuelsenbergensis TaxID=3068305 RepID=A0ABY9L2I8_9LACO|nr:MULTISPECIES: arsenate reductase (thioredoxin) [Lacticaseibacillus]MDE3283776.1 arsenate reductase (thioredoxin) [Lacticaseibacillus casei]WLV77904.1 arsenate reductase (thioredoxin) [Lacticaseibacillus sp. NCIMB 15471]
MPRVYFLCTGNACRSQMAEGFAKRLLSQQWQVRSAGLEAHGLNPLATKVMAEKGIDISRQQSKVIDNAALQQADLIVTLCGDARDRCPWTPPSVRRLHWPLKDPAAATGSPTEVLQEFRNVRDAIEIRVRALAASADNKQDQN